MALNNALSAAALHDICEAFGSSAPRRIREESSGGKLAQDCSTGAPMRTCRRCSMSGKSPTRPASSARTYEQDRRRVKLVLQPQWRKTTPQ